jgi:hypothetical protein
MLEHGYNAKECYDQISDGWKISEIAKESDTDSMGVYHGLKHLGVVEHCMEEFPRSGIVACWYEDMVDSGLTIEEIAELGYLQEGTVKTALNRLGLMKTYLENHPKGDKSRSVSAKDWYGRMVGAGLTIEDMARVGGVEENSVEVALRTHRLMEIYRKIHPDVGSEEWYDQMVEGGLTIEGMAEWSGLDYEHVQMDLYSFGLMGNYRRNHPDVGSKEWYRLMIAGGVKIDEMARRIGIDWRRVQVALSTKGLMREYRKENSDWRSELKMLRMESAAGNKYPGNGDMDFDESAKGWYTRMVEAGLTIEEMARVGGIEEKSVVVSLSIHKLTETYRKHHPLVGSEDWYTRMVEAGLTAEDMARAEGIGKRSFKGALRRHRLMKRYRKMHPREGSKEWYRRMVDFDLTIEEIAKLGCRHEQTVKVALRKHRFMKRCLENYPKEDEPQAGFSVEEDGDMVFIESPGKGRGKASGTSTRDRYIRRLKAGWSLERIARREEMLPENAAMVITDVLGIMGKDDLERYKRLHP